MWWLPLGLVTLLGALLVFRQGWIAATITETDAINRAALRYLEQAGAGALPTDCLARPTPDAWIEVTCTAGSGAQFRYVLDRMGRFVAPNAASGPEA